MTPVQIKCIQSISNKCGAKYKGITFDGCYFYLTCPDMCEVVKFDKCFCEMEHFKTVKPYMPICYDPERNCYWAATNKNYNKLFKLNLSFQEIDCIYTHPCDDCGAIITGISYNFQNNSLMISFTNCVVSMYPSDPENYEVIQKSLKTWNMGVLSIAPSYMIIATQDCRQYIAVYNCENRLKFKIDIPSEYFADAIIFYPCECKNNNNSHNPLYHFYILATKNGCYSYLLEWTVDYFEYDIFPCNFLICNKNFNCDEHEPCNSIAGIIESIASVETALSHILNAEGEKLQKIIACTDDIDKILCANEAVNQTIVNATHLEIILHNKLTLLNQCFSISDNPSPFITPCEY